MANKECNLPNVLNIREVAEALHCKPKTVYKLVAADELKSFRIGNRIRIKEDDLLAYISKTM